MNRIAASFQKAREAGRAAFVPYLCAGDPDFETSLAACRAVIENGADILEIGVPFSDPLADGLTNQLAAQRALLGGMTQERVFQLVERIRQFSDLPIVLYTYYNLVFSIGETEYAQRAKAAGVDGLLTLDLPPEEAGTLIDACDNEGLANIFIIAPTTPEARIQLICKHASGFLYYVSRTGVTGERERLADGLKEAVERIKRHATTPVVVGFGISKPEQVTEVGTIADGVVVGSAIVNCIRDHADDPAAAVTAITAKVRYLLGQQ